MFNSGKPFHLPPVVTVGIITPFLLVAVPVHASTAAFCGVVKEVSDRPSNNKDCLREFTVRIMYYDYISWGRFGRHSQVGETIARRVKPLGTACILNGRLINAPTFL